MNIEAWKVRDITCRNYILASTHQSQKILLYPCTTAREMWVKLSSQHAARADDPIHQRWQELYDYKYDPENNVTSYINGILSIAYKLREINEPIPERQILNKILAALPPTFRMVRSAWTVVSANERTIDNLTQRLVAEEKVIASYESELKDEETSTAFRAHNSSNQRPRGGHQAGKVDIRVLEDTNLTPGEEHPIATIPVTTTINENGRNLIKNLNVHFVRETLIKRKIVENWRRHERYSREAKVAT